MGTQEQPGVDINSSAMNMILAGRLSEESLINEWPQMIFGLQGFCAESVHVWAFLQLAPKCPHAGLEWQLMHGKCIQWLKASWDETIKLSIQYQALIMIHDIRGSWGRSWMVYVRAHEWTAGQWCACMEWHSVSCHIEWLLIMTATGSLKFESCTKLTLDSKSHGRKICKTFDYSAYFWCSETYIYEA